MLNPIVIIPARMASTRLPGKPLADIAGLPMIVQVLKRAVEADIGPVVVACAEAEIIEAVEAAGGRAVLTDPDHPSGSDRIFEALQKVDPNAEYDAIVNLQGDLPVLEASVVHAAIKPLADESVDIATLVAEITVEEEKPTPTWSRRWSGSKTARMSGGRCIFPAPPCPMVTARCGITSASMLIAVRAYSALSA